MRNKLIISALLFLSACLLSIPWLLPHSGLVLLIAFFPLLLAEELALQLKIKRFALYHYGCFVLWNAFTTFWVCNATVGGGLFAIFANAFQMSLIFGLFHYSRRKLGGVLPYILLAAAWVAWERFYHSAEISWPWLTLGNAFAGTTTLVQWYEWTGAIGGSLWVWLANLGLYGLFITLSTGSCHSWTKLAKICSVAALTLLIFGPIALSLMLYHREEDKGEEIEVLIGQPNLDPYHKFESMSQAQQTELLLSIYESELKAEDSLLIIAPETFTSDIVIGDIHSSPTVQRFSEFLSKYPGSELLFGASTYSIVREESAPSPLARPYGGAWLESHNSALLMDSRDSIQLHQKSKLVVAVEQTPYPKIFVPLENFICQTFGLQGPLMGRCVGAESPTVLQYRDSIPFGCAVCYESIYGEYCSEYVRKGARFLTVITNDAWWGDTPGYRQHCNYSRLRAIETRRDIARCGNTGISCIINSKGDIVTSGPWWEEFVMRSKLQIHDKETLFVRHGDLCGRVCTLVFLLMLLLLVAKMVKRS